VLLYLTYCRTRRRMVEGAEGERQPRLPSCYMCSLPPDLVERAA
jgi:hypothetical protein